jgi:hypothetical protein
MVEAPYGSFSERLPGECQTVCIEQLSDPCTLLPARMRLRQAAAVSSQWRHESTGARCKFFSSKLAPVALRTGDSGAIRFEWRRHAVHFYSTTVILSGAHPRWKPNGTRTGSRIVATDGRAFVGAVLVREKHPWMLRQVGDGEIARSPLAAIPNPAG